MVVFVVVLFVVAVVLALSVSGLAGCVVVVSGSAIECDLSVSRSLSLREVQGVSRE